MCSWAAVVASRSSVRRSAGDRHPNVQLHSAGPHTNSQVISFHREPQVLDCLSNGYIGATGSPQTHQLKYNNRPPFYVPKTFCIDINRLQTLLLQYGQKRQKKFNKNLSMLHMLC